MGGMYFADFPLCDFTLFFVVVLVCFSAFGLPRRFPLLFLSSLLFRLLFFSPIISTPLSRDDLDRESGKEWLEESDYLGGGSRGRVESKL